MKKIVLVSAITVALAAASATTARAGISFGIHIGFPPIPVPTVVVPAPPVCVTPAPVYVPRIVVAPAPVCAPTPVCVTPAPVYYQPYPRHPYGAYVRYYGHGRHHYIHHRHSD